MITREEAKQNLCMNLLCSEASGVSWVADDFVIELIDQLFDQQYQLEQHIKLLEIVGNRFQHPHLLEMCK